MALTPFQIAVLRLLAERRKRDGVSYVAGGAALNTLLKQQRRSHDLDLFHDSSEALRKTWPADRGELADAGYIVEVVREAPSFIEAVIRKENNSVLIQWVRDSAYRFFPLCEDPVLGLALHPLDLATNKILAATGRLEPRDWVDALACHRDVQPLGYLIWAACGKDPGVNPDMLLDQCARLHYAQEEIDVLDFEGAPPRARDVSSAWKQAVSQGKQIVETLPEDHLGECVLSAEGMLCRASAAKLKEHLAQNEILFHQGCIGGVWPRIAGSPIES